MSLSTSTSSANTLPHESTCGLEYCNGLPASACPLPMTFMPFQHVFHAAARMILSKLLSIMAFLCSNPPMVPNSFRVKLDPYVGLKTRRDLPPPYTQDLISFFLLSSLLPSFCHTHLLALFPGTRHKPTHLECSSYRYSQDLLPHPF